VSVGAIVTVVSGPSIATLPGSFPGGWLLISLGTSVLITILIAIFVSSSIATASGI
jgi:hypothetical protein